MGDRSHFRRNLIIIAVLHLLVIGGLWFSGVFSNKTSDEVTWLDGGGEVTGASKEGGAAADPGGGSAKA